MSPTEKRFHDIVDASIQSVKHNTEKMISMKEQLQSRRDKTFSSNVERFSRITQRNFASTRGCV